MTRDELLQPATLPLQPVKFRGADFTVRELTAAESVALGKHLAKPDAGDAYHAVVVAHNLRDAEGTRVFTDADATALAKLPLRILKPVVEAVGKLSGNSDPNG